MIKAGFKTLSSGFVREGIYWKDNPKKILFKLLTLPILLLYPHSGTFYGWLLKKNRDGNFQSFF